MLSSKIAKRSLKTLRRRQDYLIDRINMSDVDLSFDKSESAALGVSITLLEALMKGQKVEVSHDRARRNPLQHKAGQEAQPSQGECNGNTLPADQRLATLGRVPFSLK
jgi:hypothetical protein